MGLYQEGLLEMIDELIMDNLVLIKVEILSLNKKNNLARIRVRSEEPKGSGIDNFVISVEKKFLTDITPTSNGIFAKVLAIRVPRENTRKIIIKSPQCTPNEGWCTPVYIRSDMIFLPNIKEELLSEQH